MRDRRADAPEGREDPWSDPEGEEPAYDFVSLPGAATRGDAVGHDRYPARGRFSGTMTLTYEALTPLHVGSGALESAAECGLSGGDLPVRGMARREGRPVLPGSGWKGAVRTRFEAITHSRLALASDRAKEEAQKLPRPLRDPGGSKGKHDVRLKDPRLKALQAARVKGADRREVERQMHALSPAEALFGAMGFRGRVHPSDGLISGPQAPAPLAVPPMESPAPHRLAKPGAARNSGGTNVEIAEVEGRKFYLDGKVLHSRRTGNGQAARESHEDVDQVPAGCKVTIHVQLESVSERELGALLISAGYGANSGIVRFGGFKPAGLGKVQLVEIAGELQEGHATRSWRRPPGRSLDGTWIDLLVAVALEGLVDREALRELDAVTRRLRP